VDVIMVGSTQATRAAKAATTSIPIVMLSIGEPARSGLVESLARPGGNVTGTSNSMVDVAPKHLDLLRDLAPKLRRVAFLMSSGGATHQDILEIVRAHAPRAGVQITPLAVSSEADIEAAFASMVKQKLQAVIVPTSAQMIGQRQLVADLALKSRLPCLGYNATYADAGFLLSYGANLLETFRRSAVYVDKILKGAKPADLPIEMPTLFELVINKKTAQAIGVTIPRALLVRADRVIE
jgi:putative ABC transport system substrate-binding protein